MSHSNSPSPQQSLSASQKRQKLRQVFTGTDCLTPASVHDALSARVAQIIGHQIGMLGGSVASAVTLSAPDLTVLTLSELAQCVRAICRTSNLALFVDADHGYGNALSVGRTIEELEHAGAAGCSIEDTLLPARFGATQEELISCDEMLAKLHAAVRAKQDPAFVIAGRSIALKHEGLEATLTRLKAYAATGVDAIFVLGLTSIDQLHAIQSNIDLPLMLGTIPTFANRNALASMGVRIALQGHLPYAAAIETYRKIYAHLLTGGAPEELKAQLPSQDFLDEILQKTRFKA